MGTNYIALAIPFFFLLIGVELLVARVMKRKVYRLNDSINDLSCGVIQRLIVLFCAAFMIASYLAIYEQARLFSLSASSPWVWVVAFFATDFIYYWFHRFSHEVNFLWAAHVVHHQSEEYNLSVALRQSAFQPFFSSVFYWPLALVGLPPLVFLTVSAFNTLYQFWIHTRIIGKLGPLESVLMTPSHHRVHHGRNPKYVDRNHGGNLIIWDKLFGTFQAEEEEPTYGITKPLATWNPIWANLATWSDLLEAARRTRAWRDKLLMFLKPPGWHPADLGGFEPAPDISGKEEPYDPVVSTSLAWYLFLQFAIVIAATTVFIFQAANLPQTTKLLSAAMVIVSLVVFGGLLERRKWAFVLEALRLLAIPLTAALLIQKPDGLIIAAIAATYALFCCVWLLRHRSSDLQNALPTA